MQLTSPFDEETAYPRTGKITVTVLTQHLCDQCRSLESCFLCQASMASHERRSKTAANEPVAMRGCVAGCTEAVRSGVAGLEVRWVGRRYSAGRFKSSS